MNLKRVCLAIMTALMATAILEAAEFHVAVNGNDTGDGSNSSPFHTIQHAADMAQPGDTITVHTGTYRERVNPPRGGTSDDKRIVYRAAPQESVEIKGSEAVTGWVNMQGDTWKVTLPNSFFGSFNPYHDLIRGDYFDPKGREHHTGAVYLNGDWLTEAAKIEDVMKPVGNAPLWFAQVDATNTTLWAQFKGVNPNEQLVEINVRQAVFYPDSPGRNYITVRGFTMRHAATPWAPPTAEQIGLIGTHWSKGWIIESNVISHSICSGITLGKYGDGFDNTSADTAEGYVKTIERAHDFPIAWTRENIGHHIVRNNTISHCEQAGIVGSLGAAFSTITGNDIHDIHVRQLFTGAEMAGIKLHAAIDTTIRRNHIYRTCRGLWLDWMSQGTRVSQNLFHENSGEDLVVEANHGPFLADNNIFLSPTSLLDISEGGAYAHNLFGGRIIYYPDQSRETPFNLPHSTTVADRVRLKGGDDRFYNNIFVGVGQLPTDSDRELWKYGRANSYGLWKYDGRGLPLQTGGNVYFYGAGPCANEANPVRASHNPKIRLVRDGVRTILRIKVDHSLKEARTALVTTALLGKARIAGLCYHGADDSPLAVDSDYCGRRRSQSRPMPGPFENIGEGEISFAVW